MSVRFYTATLTAAGTPQKLLSSITPSLGAITGSMAGYETVRAFHILVQAWPSNTGANIYLGGPTLSKTGPVACGAVVVKASAPISLGQYGGSAELENIYFDGDTTSDKLLITIVD